MKLILEFNYDDLTQNSLDDFIGLIRLAYYISNPPYITNLSNGNLEKPANESTVGKSDIAENAPHMSDADIKLNRRKEIETELKKIVSTDMAKSRLLKDILLSYGVKKFRDVPDDKLEDLLQRAKEL